MGYSTSSPSGSPFSNPFANPNHAITRQQPLGFDPFSKGNVTVNSDKNDDGKVDEDDDDILEDLHQRFIATTILVEDDDDYVPVQLPSTETSAFMQAEDRIASNSNTLNNSTYQQPAISIWEKATSALTTEDYYSNDQEFDPTLQYYHGELYDTATIQDLDRFSLQAQVPSAEELQEDNVEQDMSSLQMLQTIFKDLSEAELLETLEIYDYDADAAIEDLIRKKILTRDEQQESSSQSSKLQTDAKFKEASATSTALNTMMKVPGDTPSTKITIVPPLSLAAQQQQQETFPVPRRRQVCRHFLAGECYRKDCWFSHDLQDKVCKFWLQGSCLKGDSCEFSHTIDLEEVANKITTTASTVTTGEHNSDNRSYNPEEYPALSSSSKQVNKSNFSARVTDQEKHSSVVNEEFPSLATAAKIVSGKKAVQSNSWSNTSTNFAEVAKKKKDDPIKTKQLLLKKNKYRYTPQHRKYSMQDLSQPVHIPWLETGSSLNSIYMKERQKAIEYGMLRNRFFNKATECYLKGDGAKAKLYSMEAKHYNKLMQDMHAEASKRIFESRSTSEAFIDLHGLHEDEAMKIVEQRLMDLKGKYSGIIYIVTGTGHHSGSGGLSKKQSKLKPIVHRYLKEHHYHFAETSVVNDNQGGVFAVEIS